MQPPTDETKLKTFGAYVKEIAIIVLATFNYMQYQDMKQMNQQQILFWRDAFIKTNEAYQNLTEHESAKDSTVYRAADTTGQSWQQH